MLKSIYTADQERLQAVLKQTRLKAGLNQTELAAKLGRPQSFVAKIENGERRVDLVELRYICRALGVPLTRFVQEFEKALRK